MTRWKAELTFTGSGRTGTFQFPTLGCSGNLVVIRLNGTTATAQEDITRNQRGMCAPGGLITLNRATASMNMSWQDPSDHSNVATAHLAPAN